MEKHYYAGSFTGNYLKYILRFRSKADRDKFLADYNCIELNGDKKYRPITRERARKKFPCAFRGAKWEKYYFGDMFDLLCDYRYSRG